MVRNLPRVAERINPNSGQGPTEPPPPRLYPPLYCTNFCSAGSSPLLLLPLQLQQNMAIFLHYCNWIGAAPGIWVSQSRNEIQHALAGESNRGTGSRTELIEDGQESSTNSRLQIWIKRSQGKFLCLDDVLESKSQQVHPSCPLNVCEEHRAKLEVFAF